MVKARIGGQPHEVADLASSRCSRSETATSEILAAIEIRRTDIFRYSLASLETTAMIAASEVTTSRRAIGTDP